MKRSMKKFFVVCCVLCVTLGGCATVPGTNSAEYYYKRGDACASKQGDAARAIEAFTQAIALKPDYAEAYYARSAIYYLKEDYDRAIADYTQAINNKPDSLLAYFYRADAYGKKGDYERAIEDFTRYITIAPDDADGYINRGVMYYRMNNFEDALTDFYKAIEIKPDIADLKKVIALLQLKMSVAD